MPVRKCGISEIPGCHSRKSKPLAVVILQATRSLKRLSNMSAGFGLTRNPTHNHPATTAQLIDATDAQVEALKVKGTIVEMERGQ